MIPCIDYRRLRQRLEIVQYGSQGRARTYTPYVWQMLLSGNFQICTYSHTRNAYISTFLSSLKQKHRPTCHQHLQIVSKIGQPWANAIFAKEELVNGYETNDILKWRTLTVPTTILLVTLFPHISSSAYDWPCLSGAWWSPSCRRVLAQPLDGKP